jgi:hypothetical protein
LLILAIRLIGALLVTPVDGDEGDLFAVDLKCDGCGGEVFRVVGKVGVLVGLEGVVVADSCGAIRMPPQVVLSWFLKLWVYVL